MFRGREESKRVNNFRRISVVRVPIVLIEATVIDLSFDNPRKPKCRHSLWERSKDRLFVLVLTFELGANKVDNGLLKLVVRDTGKDLRIKHFMYRAVIEFVD